MADFLISPRRDELSVGGAPLSLRHQTFLESLATQGNSVSGQIDENTAAIAVNAADILNLQDAVGETDRLDELEALIQELFDMNHLKDMWVTSHNNQDVLSSRKQNFTLEVHNEPVLVVTDTLATGFDAPSITATGDTTSYTTLGDYNDVGRPWMRPDGLAMYMVDHETNPGTIYEFEFGTAWDLTSMIGTPTQTYVMQTADHVNHCTGVAFNSDGTKAIVSTPTDCHSYTFSAGWDLSTANYVSSAATGLSTHPEDEAFVYSGDGTKAYMISRAYSVSRWYVNHFALGTPWDVTTLGLVSTTEITDSLRDLAPYTSSVKTPYGVSFSDDGYKMFTVSDNTRQLSDTSRVNEYHLTIPWDPTTAAWQGYDERGILTQSRYMRWHFWKPQGLIFFCTNNDRTLYEYTSQSDNLGGLVASLNHDGNTKLQTTSNGVRTTGILDVEGVNAQVGLPNYDTANLPATAHKGGIVYDSQTERVTVFDGTQWTATGQKTYTQDSQPTNPSIGDHWFDTLNKSLLTYTAGGWERPILDGLNF